MTFINMSMCIELPSTNQASSAGRQTVCPRVIGANCEFMNLKPNAVSRAREPADGPVWLGVVLESVASIRFGVVEIVVHDGRVTQVEKTECVRFENGLEVGPAACGSRLVRNCRSNETV